MRNSILRILAFICILCITLYVVNGIFKFKYGDGIYGLTKLYEQEDNSIDVLVLGSSHAFEDINTGILWDEQGMASYVLAGSTQPLWSTYYYLKEALKTQRPELIVLEGFMITEEYIDDYIIIKNNFGLKWSANKIKSLNDSIDKENWSDYYLEYRQYHTRYRELSEKDFLPNQNDKMYENWKGFGCNMVTMPLEAMDVSNIESRSEIPAKNEKYYRMIIELAREENIPIVVVISPYAEINEAQQSMYNTASDIAQEYNVKFVNFNLFVEEIGLDYSTDTADWAHLNYLGNQKYTSYLGNYLKREFEITDRRGDSNYSSWQGDADYFRQLICNQELNEKEDISSILEMLDNEAYWVMVSVDGNCSTSDENVRELMEFLDINDEDAKGMWLKQKNQLVWSSCHGDSEKYVEDARNVFALKSTENGGDNSILLNNTPYKKVTNGVTVVVYDTVTGKVADKFSIDMDNGYSLVR